MYKRFAITWICFANPWIHFVSWSQILFASLILKDSICDLNFQRFNLFSRIQLILTNPDESLVHRCTMNRTDPYKSLGFGFVNLYGVQKIRFVDSFRLRCSKDSFCGFVLSYGIQKICFVDFFRKNKESKRFYSQGPQAYYLLTLALIIKTHP